MLLNLLQFSFAIGSRTSWFYHQLHINDSFLQGHLNEEIYICCLLKVILRPKIVKLTNSNVL